MDQREKCTHTTNLNEATALEVEATLIDAYPGLTNIVGGTGGTDYGAMHAKEIIRRYSAEPAAFRPKVLLISVNRSAAEMSLYEATRYAWKIYRSKAMQAEVILATLQGLIVGAFFADDWLEAAAKNSPGRTDVPGRLGFVGLEALGEIKRMYVHKRVPGEYRKPGAPNAIKFKDKRLRQAAYCSATKDRPG